MDKYIFHIDLNAFYAVCEQIRSPELENKPVAIAGKRKRGVITTATYEARAYGVKSAMNVSEALRLCPDLTLVESDHSYYSKMSKKFVKFLKQYTDLVQQVSIDECYLDLTNEVKQYKRPLDLAIKIQNDLLEQLKLKSSIGISVNKFLAKMASDMLKPMGITLIRKNEIENKIFNIDISYMHGIGKKTAPMLKNIGVKTIGDLLNKDLYIEIKEILKNNTDKILEKIQGIGNDELDLEEDIKSIGNSSTFMEDVTDYDIIKNKFFSMANKVTGRLNSQKLVSNNLTITIRTNDFKTITRSKTLDYDTNNIDDIFEEALLLFDNENIEDPIRLVGISMNNLKSEQLAIKQLKLEI